MFFTIQKRQERSPMSETGSLIEMKGPHGRFAIAGAGGIPELENAFFYDDGRRKFFFYADLAIRLDNDFDIVVKHATSQRFEGRIAPIPPGEQREIEDNIKQFFSIRDFPLIQRLISKDADRPREVIFTWSIAS